jgi:hypothetical protein
MAAVLIYILVCVTRVQATNTPCSQTSVHVLNLVPLTEYASSRAEDRGAAALAWENFPAALRSARVSRTCGGTRLPAAVHTTRAY